MSKPAYWLCKSEPDVYSFENLVRDGKTHWDHVRNFQARNNLRLMKKGDQVLIYHSNEGKAVVGIAEVIREAYPDIDPEGGDWSQVDLKPVQAFKTPVTLQSIKSNKTLSGIALIKQSRLSVMPVNAAHFQALKKLGGI